VFGVMGAFITVPLIAHIAHSVLLVIRKKKEFKEHAKKTI
jgi:hypothetical protein